MSNKHFIWKDVFRNGRVVKQRYYVNNAEDKIISSEKPFGGDSYASAELKDRLMRGFFYNNIFYDTKGERIKLTDTQYQEAIKKFSDPTVFWKNSDNYEHMLKQRREQFLRLLPIINAKDSLFLKEIEKKEIAAEKFNTITNRISILKGLANRISLQSDIKHIKDVCRMIEMMMQTTDFDVTIRRNGNATTIPFDTFKTSIDKQTNDFLKLNIRSVEVVDIDNFDLGMFKTITVNINFTDIYNKINAIIKKQGY